MLPNQSINDHDQLTGQPRLKVVTREVEWLEAAALALWEGVREPVAYRVLGPRSACLSAAINLTGLALGGRLDRAPRLEPELPPTPFLFSWSRACACSGGPFSYSYLPVANKLAQSLNLEIDFGFREWSSNLGV